VFFCVFVGAGWGVFLGYYGFSLMVFFGLSITSVEGLGVGCMLKKLGAKGSYYSDINTILQSEDHFDFKLKDASELLEKLEPYYQAKGVPNYLMDFSKVPLSEINLGGLKQLDRHVEEFSQSLHIKPALLMNHQALALARTFSVHFDFYENFDLARQHFLNEILSDQLTMEFTEAVSYATKFIFERSCRIFVKPQAVRSNLNPPALHEQDIMAMVHLAKAPFDGMMILHFPLQTYLNVMSRFLRMDFKQMEPLLNSGATEMLNMVYGRTKMLLDFNQKFNFPYQGHIPWVLKEKDYLEAISEMSHMSLHIPFETEVGDFNLLILKN